MGIYPPEIYTAISTTEGHVDSFGELFNALRERWVKVERLQEYDESDSEGYRAFKRGDYAVAQRLVEVFVKGQDVYEIASRHGVSMVRVRIYDEPLSEYLNHYEMYAYLADIECGEDIRFVDSASISDILSATGISDYVLFDTTRLVALVYDDLTGRLDEARLVKDESVIADYIEVTNELISRSVSMLESPAFRDWKLNIAQ
jgi:hypothetical protein